MSRIRYAVAGNGWRAMFFIRAAKNLPELFELTGVLLRTREKAEAFAAAHDVPVFTDLDAMLETKPDFVVSCVTKSAISQMTIDIMERGVPVLSETPLATDVDTLTRIWETHRRTGVPLEMAEQYFLYPSHQARRALVERGIVGEVSSVWMNMMHDYHGISMLRAYLYGGKREPDGVVIRRLSRQLSIAHTGDRSGVFPGITNAPETRVFAQFIYSDGRVGLYDFAGSQYHSAIRGNHMRVLGDRGEIFDDEVRYLLGDHRPAKANLEYRCDAVTGTVRAIDFDGMRVYENPFRTDVVMTEDDIAVCTVMVRMARGLIGGDAHYEHAFRDSYLSILLTKDAQEDVQVQAQKMPWD